MNPTLRIDSSGTQYMAASEPKPVLEHGTDRQKIDKDGQALYVVQLVALVDASAEVLAVRVAGPLPKGITQGVSVRCVGLTATYWQMGERSGLSYRAERIEVASPVRQPA